MQFKQWNQRLSDEWHWRLVRLLFKGYRARDKQGVAYRAFFKGKYEELARTFLAHALKTGRTIPFDVCGMLGVSLGDDVDMQWGNNHRKLSFTFRRQGNRPDGIRELDLLEKFANAKRMYGKQEAALAHMRTEYGISRSEMLRIAKASGVGTVDHFVRVWMHENVNIDPTTLLEQQRQGLADRESK